MFAGKPRPIPWSCLFSGHHDLERTKLSVEEARTQWHSGDELVELFEEEQKAGGCGEPLLHLSHHQELAVQPKLAVDQLHKFISQTVQESRSNVLSDGMGWSKS